MKLTIFVCCLLLFPFLLQAQDFSTDRPGEGTNEANVLPKGYFQLESGFYYEHDNSSSEGEITDLLVPSTSLRIGLLERVEFRVAKEYYAGDDPGKGPLSLGTKIKLRDETENAPGLAFQTMLTLPNSGSEEYQTNYTQPSMRLIASKDVSELLSLTVNLGSRWEEDEPRANYFYGFSAQASVSDEIAIFGEIYGVFPEGLPNQHLVDYGITYLLLPNLQLDASSGAALTTESTDYFVSLGLSWRMRAW